MTTARPSRRDTFAAAAAVVAAAAIPAGAARAQAQAREAKPNKVVVQVSDADPHKWTLALSNAYNVLNGVGAEPVDLEIVVYGPGIGMLKRDSAVGDRVASAMNSGIRIVACENTMAAQKLTPADMLPRIGYVPAGVVEIMRRQQQGYAYVRP